ncbi:MAG: DUF4838 domain-containing protein [Kiritimatiellia bacterium]|nr:DUF4838 domain-containing protein [Lentisphaerota bacterium]
MRAMKKIRWLGSGLLVMGLCAVSQAEPMVLVRSGASLAPIVVYEDAPPYTRRAADELALYIEKISGVRPEVLVGRPDPLPEHAVWVGYQPVLREVMPGVDFDFQHPEEIMIACDGRHLVIAGRDRWNPDSLVVATGRDTITGYQQEYGTINAVYTYLRDYLDVRWLWPGELGEDIIRRQKIVQEPCEYRYHPQIRNRSTLFRLSALGDNRGRSFEWTRFQRLQLDSLNVPGGHPQTGWWERYHEDHPEYFALQPDGKRSGFPAPKLAKLCVSNPGVWDQWMVEVEEHLARDPNATVFGANPNDSYHRGHCICENCRAWDHPDGEMRSYTWQGLSQEYVAISDRLVIFANHLGRLLRERYPDRDYYVLISAYGNSRPAPVAAVPAANVIVGNVANMFWGLDARDRNRPDGPTVPEQFAAWARVAGRQQWRPNTGSAGGWQQGQPDVPLSRTAESFKFAAAHGCIGIFVDTIWEYWATQGPLYYLVAHLAWNPDTDPRALMDDYYQRGFGPAAPQLQAYWELLEEARNRKVDGDLPFGEVYDAALLARADRLLDEAENAVSGAPEHYARRIAFMRAGLEYTRLMVEIRTLMAQYRESREQDTAAADKVRANWERLQEIARDNLMRILQPGTRYAGRLHPD